MHMPIDPRAVTPGVRPFLLGGRESYGYNAFQLAPRDGTDIRVQKYTYFERACIPVFFRRGNILGCASVITLLL